MTISRPLRSAAPLLALTLVLGLGACGTATEDDPGSTSDTSTSDTAPTTGDAAPTTDDGRTTEEPSVTSLTPSDPTSGGTLPTGPVPDAIVAREDVQTAIADLADTQSVDAAQVTVAGFQEVTWSDGSIGCPKPGMMYTQALVPGYLLVLDLDGELFSYHAARDKAFTYCADPKLPNPGASSATATM